MTEQEFKEGLELRLENCYSLIEEAKKQNRLGTSIYGENGEFLGPVIGELREQYQVDILQVGPYSKVASVEIVVTWGHD